MIIEMRAYKTKPGKRAHFLEIFRICARPRRNRHQNIRSIYFDRRSQHVLFHAWFSRSGFTRAHESQVL